MMMVSRINTYAREFTLVPDFTHGNTSQRAYEVGAIVALNNRPRHFSVPADKYARSALVRYATLHLVIVLDWCLRSVLRIDLRHRGSHQRRLPFFARASPGINPTSPLSLVFLLTNTMCGRGI